MSGEKKRKDDNIRYRQKAMDACNTEERCTWYTSIMTLNEASGPCGLSSIPPKLQALVYDILPSTTAVFSYAIGS